MEVCTDPKRKRERQRLERRGEIGSGVRDKGSLRMIFFCCVVLFFLIYWLTNLFVFFFVGMWISFCCCFHWSVDYYLLFFFFFFVMPCFVFVDSGSWACLGFGSWACHLLCFFLPSWIFFCKFNCSWRLFSSFVWLCPLGSRLHRASASKSGIEGLVNQAIDMLEGRKPVKRVFIKENKVVL